MHLVYWLFTVDLPAAPRDASRVEEGVVAFDVARNRERPESVRALGSL